MTQERADDPGDRILDGVGGWYDDFIKGSEFNRLKDEDKLIAWGVVEMFARYMHDYLDVSPQDWDSDSVVECCTEILPRKVSAELSFFQALAPVLGAFFNFLAERSLLRQGRELAETVVDIHDDILTAAQDRSHWGPAKCFVMAAQEAGVDVNDPQALQHFQVRTNLALMERQMARQTHANVGPYDPCPCGSGKKYKFCCAAKDRET